MRIAIINKFFFTHFPYLILYLILLLHSLISSCTYYSYTNNSRIGGQHIDGKQAINDVEQQVGMGARIPGSEAHDQTIAWIKEELKEANWAVETQEAQILGHDIVNIIAKKGVGRPWIIIGAHYDSRIYADRDRDITKREMPVTGANDGASGVAVLLGIARTLSGDRIQQSWANQVWLVFFDAEDNGNINGWDWVLGSKAFVDGLKKNYPDSVIVVDMVGDRDLNIFMEGFSNPELSHQIWTQAALLKYGEVFIPEIRRNILDDHVPFVRAGIPSVGIIDFDYAFWHTTSDTIDKVSEGSLQIVGDTLLAWLLQYPVPLK